MLVYEADTGALFDLDSTTGASNFRPTGTFGLVGIEFGAGGTLYGLSGSSGVPVPNALFSINPTTGVPTFIGPTGLGLILEGGLAYNPANSTLYGLYDLATPFANVFSLDTTTGAATVLWGIPVAFRDLSAMAFDGAGNLIMLDTDKDTVLRVDLLTGGVLAELPLIDSGNPANLSSDAGMDFDPVSGKMFVVDSGTHVLYTLDPASGVLTFLLGGLTVSAGEKAGLAVIPQATTVPVSEPAMFTLFGLGLAGLALAMRKRAVSP